MLLSTFMEYALEGYGVVMKDGVLERVPRVPMKRTFSHKRKSKPTQSENVQTIVAFIEAVKEQHGALCSHLATLLLVETIQKKGPLEAEVILSTYQSMLEIEEVLTRQFPCFVKLPLPQQKEYMLIMANTKMNIRERERVSTSFLFHALFARTNSTIEMTQ